VLQTSVDAKYSLSQKACAGILARSARRARSIPTALKVALEAVAEGYSPTPE
jgi:hypothetical protein